MAEPPPDPAAPPLSTPPEIDAPPPPPPSPPDEPPAPARAPLYDRARKVVLPVLLAAAIAAFLAVVHRSYPIHKWLFWRYAGYWVGALALCLGCLSAGHLTLKRLLPSPLPLVEHLGSAFAAGVLWAFVGMSITGFLHLYGTAFFFAFPLAMIATGALPLYRYLRRATRHLRHARSKAKAPPLWHYGVLVFGIIGFAMIYALIMTPANIQFDSRWKHFAVAEDYLVTGGIRKFPEGWTLVTDPQLPILLYTWAFQLPGRLFDRVELAAHVEFFVFVGTTLTIPALVRVLVPRMGAESGNRRGGARTAAMLSWAARFAFPGVFLYDSSLSGGADHVAGLFVVPMFLALLRAWRDLSPRRCAVLALMAAGGLMGKYTALLMLLPVPAVALVVRGIWLGIRRKTLAPAERNNWWLGPVVTLTLGLALTAPHWAKNWVWYGDPLYPQLHKILKVRPWTVDGADVLEWGYKDHQFWRPNPSLTGVLDTLAAMFNFSLWPNDWGKFHGKMPVFGSLYSLTMVCLLFFRKTLRIWAVIGCVQLAILVWYWTNHQDRYLQTLMPWMTAVTAATLILLWRQGIVTRTAAGALVGAQVVWGGDIYFIPTHAMCKSPVKQTIDFLARGYSGDYEKRFTTYPDWVDVGAATPLGSRVLLHDIHVHLGIGRQTVNDFTGWQFGISYGRQKTPGDVWSLLNSLGVTHLVWTKQGSRGWDSVAGDLVFFNFVTKYGVGTKTLGNNILVRMPDAPPPPETNDVVLYLGCNNHYKAGLYHLSDLTVPVYGPNNNKYPKPFQPKASTELAELSHGAAFAVLDPKCAAAASRELPGLGFKMVAQRKVMQARTPPTPKEKMKWGNGGRALELWIRTTQAVDKPSDELNEDGPEPEPPKNAPPAKDDDAPPAKEPE